MLAKLIGKEFSLCLHPTAIVFLFFSAFVFIPNYPYEMMFFFSGLSVFFICLTARENGDAAFSCTLPVRKEQIALARMFMCAILQVAMLVCAGITTAVKELLFPAGMQVNMAGISANTAFLGFGAVLLGVFNLVFFPAYYKNPARVGVPFVIASSAEFALIFLLIAFRFTVPFFRDTLNTPDPANMGVKTAVLIAGLAVYLGLTALSCTISAKRFSKTDL